MTYWVYIMASRTKVLYVGMTGDLQRRMIEHKQRVVPGFTRTYHVTRLVYCQDFEDAASAIACEKQVKGWVRHRKIQLVESVNPEWLDLSSDLFPSQGALSS